jgi:hypothetical protein
MEFSKGPWLRVSRGLRGTIARMKAGVLAALVVALAPWIAQQPPSTAEPLHRPFDQILDLYVRDGYVYYRALRSERARLDRYVASLNVPAATYGRWSREQQIAFWVNAYNAFVLQAVAQHYPIRGRSAAYPPNSIRQIPGLFEKHAYRAAGKTVTLDEIEKTILPQFRDPRLYFALGRGAEGSGRLRSEAYTVERLEEQLRSQTTDFLTRQNHVRIDRLTNQLAVSPIISWHEAEFVAAYGSSDAVPKYALSRSPIERAVLALIMPVVLPSEREFLEQNRFQVVYQDFDWTLNDLGAR